MKKRVLATLLAMSVVLGLAACGSKSDSKDDKKEETKTEAKADAAEDVELQVFIAASLSKVMDEVATEYQKDHPDVTFKFEEMGTDQIYKKLSTSLATGNGIADIIAIEGDVLVGYADKFPEGFLDVSDAINTDDFLASKIGEVSYKAPPPIKSCISVGCRPGSNVL